MSAFYKDVGTYPARSNTGANNYLYSLLTGESKPTSDPFTASHTFYTWGLDASRGDLVDNHLLRNTPGGQSSAAYPTTGQSKWRGPYLAGPAPLDPWGRPYVINVISGWYSHATSYKRIYVLCAGSDGRIDTNYLSQVDHDVHDDDIGLIVHQQK